MATPTPLHSPQPPASVCHSFQLQKPSLSDAFVKEIYCLYRQNAQNLACSDLLDIIDSEIQVTNSLIFTGSLRMQGTMRNVLIEEHGLVSFSDLMSCITAATARSILSYISPRFSSDTFFSLAGQPNSAFNHDTDLLQKLCRALIVGTNGVCRKHGKTLKETSTSGLDIDRLHLSLVALSLDRNKNFNVPSFDPVLQESIVSTASRNLSILDIPKNSKRPRPRDGHEIDENTPPRKNRAVSATEQTRQVQHKRFASMPLGKLPSNSPSRNDDGDGNRARVSDQHQKYRKASLDGALLSISNHRLGKPGKTSSSARRKFSRISDTALLAAADSPVDSPHPRRFSRLLDIHPYPTCNGTSKGLTNLLSHDPTSFNLSRKPRNSTPATINRPSDLSVHSPADGVPRLRAASYNPPHKLKPLDS